MENEYRTSSEAEMDVSSAYEPQSRKDEVLSVRRSLKGHLADTQTP